MPTRKAATKKQPKAETAPDWRIKGDWWDLCNCAIGCPCVFGSEPTHGFCEGVLTWLIREGQFGDVRLDGELAVVLIIHFEGSVFDKNREFGFLIDDRANPQQRDALERISTPSWHTHSGRPSPRRSSTSPAKAGRSENRLPASATAP